jgi:hypothetical protein
MPYTSKVERVPICRESHLAHLSIIFDRSAHFQDAGSHNIANFTVEPFPQLRSFLELELRSPFPRAHVNISN